MSIEIFIAILFLISALSRVYYLKKPFYLFGHLLKRRKASLARILSSLIMLLLAYGLTFKYFWAFWLFVLDFTIGLINHLIILFLSFHNPKELEKNIFKSRDYAISINIFLIAFWIAIAAYLFLIYFSK